MCSLPLERQTRQLHGDKSPAPTDQRSVSQPLFTRPRTGSRGYRSGGNNIVCLYEAVANGLNFFPYRHSHEATTTQLGLLQSP